MPRVLISVLNLDVTENFNSNGRGQVVHNLGYGVRHRRTERSISCMLKNYVVSNRPVCVTATLLGGSLTLLSSGERPVDTRVGLRLPPRAHVVGGEKVTI